MADNSLNVSTNLRKIGTDLQPGKFLYWKRQNILLKSKKIPLPYKVIRQNISKCD